MTASSSGCTPLFLKAEPQSQTVWRQADRYRVPRICFINKLDRTGASFDFCVTTIKQRLNAIPAILQLPIGSEGGFLGVVDLVHMRALTWRGETTIGEDYTVEEIPADMLERAQQAHHELIELVADYDDELTEAYLTDEESITASSRGCTPLFLKAEPHSTGVIEMSSVALRMSAISRSEEISFSSR